MEEIINNEVVVVKKQNNLLKIIVHVVFVLIIAIGAVYLIKNKPVCEQVKETAKTENVAETKEAQVVPTVAQDNSWKEFELKDYVKVSFQYPGEDYVYLFYDRHIPIDSGERSRFSSVDFFIKKERFDISSVGGSWLGGMNISVEYYYGDTIRFAKKETDFEKYKKELSDFEEIKFISNNIEWIHFEGLQKETMGGPVFVDNYYAFLHDKNGKQILLESTLEEYSGSKDEKYLKEKAIHEKVVKSLKITEI